MSLPILLDAYSCAGLGADGYTEHFEVVCLDDDPAALSWNPHKTILGDCRKLLLDAGFMRQFDAYHGSPPCQPHTAARELARAQGKGNGARMTEGEDLLEFTRDAFNRYDVPWVIENVDRSPVKWWYDSVRVCGSSFGLEVQRHRWFAPSDGLTLVGSVCDHASFPLDPVSGKPRPWGVYYAKGDSIPSGGRTALDEYHGHLIMGIDPDERSVPWEYLREGLPPKFTEWIGQQIAAQL